MEIDLHLQHDMNVTKHTFKIYSFNKDKLSLSQQLRRSRKSKIIWLLHINQIFFKEIQRHILTLI